MKTRKILKRGLLVLSVITVLFFGILIFHIVTAKPAVYDTPNLQISRIDFKNTIDSAQAKKICSDLRSIKGLTSDSIVVKRNVVVYFHNNSITDSKKVYDELMTKGHYDAHRFILPANMANKEVCPIDQNSFSYKMARSLNQIFN
jgi:hypothetical protein